MVRKNSEEMTETSTDIALKKRNCKKKTSTIPFLPVTDEGEELTPIEVKASPDTIGGILQQARLQKHLKLQTISKKLCIKEEFLDALEKGNYYIFPGLVYGTGFLRTYANFLDLNADELTARFKKETTDIKSTPLDMPRTHDPKVMPTAKIVLASLSFLIVLYLIWTFFRIMTYKPFPEPTTSFAVQKQEETLSAPIISDEVEPLTEEAETEILEVIEADDNAETNVIQAQKI